MQSPSVQSDQATIHNTVSSPGGVSTRDGLSSGVNDRSVELAKFEQVALVARVGFSLLLAGACASMLFMFGLAILDAVTSVDYSSYELFSIAVVLLIGNVGFGYVVKNIVRRLATALGH